MSKRSKGRAATLSVVIGLSLVGLGGCLPMASDVAAERCQKAGFTPGTAAYDQCFQDVRRRVIAAEFSTYSTIYVPQYQHQPAPLIVPTVSRPSMPPIGPAPSDPCAMMSCAPPPAPAPRYIPYDAVKDTMPGIKPDGTTW